MQMVNLQIITRFFRNYVHLQLSCFALKNKIPMIVSRVYTYTQVRPET